MIVFDNAFHGRTLLTMTMTSKVKPYKAGFGPFAPEVYRAPRPIPYRGVSSDDAIAGLERMFKSEVDPERVACVVLEPVQGEGGFIPMPPDYPARLLELCARTGSCTSTTRCSPASGGRGRCGRSSTTRRRAGHPRLGKSIGGGLPLAAVTGRAEIMDGPGPAASAGRSAATRSRAPRPPRCSRRSRAGDSRGPRRARETLHARLDALQQRHAIGEVRGLGPMVAMELVEQTPDRARRVVDAAFERGLLLLACGLYGNVIRLLPAHDRRGRARGGSRDLEEG